MSARSKILSRNAPGWANAMIQLDAMRRQAEKEDLVAHYRDMVLYARGEDGNYRRIPTVNGVADPSRLAEMSDADRQMEDLAAAKAGGDYGRYFLSAAAMDEMDADDVYLPGADMVAKVPRAEPRPGFSVLMNFREDFKEDRQGTLTLAEGDLVLYHAEADFYEVIPLAAQLAEPLLRVDAQNNPICDPAAPLEQKAELTLKLRELVQDELKKKDDDAPEQGNDEPVPDQEPLRAHLNHVIDMVDALKRRHPELVSLHPEQVRSSNRSR